MKEKDKEKTSKQKDLTKETKPGVEGTRQRTSLVVEGMVCEACRRRVRRALSRIEGVGEVEVDLSQGRATIGWEGRALEPDRLVRAVQELGFTAVLLEPETP